MTLSMKKAILRAGLLVLTMAACEQDSAEPQQTTVVTTTVTETSTTEETTAELTTTEEPAESAPEESTEPKPTDGLAPECKASTLAIELERGDAAAGKASHLLVFHNDGAKACQMVGYLKVFAVGKHGKQKIGLQAAEDRSMQPKAVVLKPGEEPEGPPAADQYRHQRGPPGDKSSSSIPPVSRVTPLNGDPALFAKGRGLKACSGEVDWLTIQPVGSAAKPGR